MPVFDKLATNNEVSGIFFATGGCPPVVLENTIRKNPQCTKKGETTLRYISDNDIKTVFLVSSWSENYKHFDDDGSHTVLEALTETIDQIPLSTNIVIMQRIPKQPEYHVRTLFYDSIKTKSVPTLSISKTSYLDQAKNSRAAIQTLAERDNVTIIDATDTLCPEDVCEISQDNKIIYADGNHLNTTGAYLLTNLIEPYIIK